MKKFKLFLLFALAIAGIGTANAAIPGYQLIPAPGEIEEFEDFTVIFEEEVLFDVSTSRACATMKSKANGKTFECFNPTPLNLPGNGTAYVLHMESDWYLPFSEPAQYQFTLERMYKMVNGQKVSLDPIKVTYTIPNSLKYVLDPPLDNAQELQGMSIYFPENKIGFPENSQIAIAQLNSYECSKPQITYDGTGTLVKFKFSDPTAEGTLEDNVLESISNPGNYNFTLRFITELYPDGSLNTGKVYDNIYVTYTLPTYKEPEPEPEPEGPISVIPKDGSELAGFMEGESLKFKFNEHTPASYTVNLYKGDGSYWEQLVNSNNQPMPTDDEGYYVKTFNNDYVFEQGKSYNVEFVLYKGEQNESNILAVYSVSYAGTSETLASTTELLSTVPASPGKLNLEENGTARITATFSAPATISSVTLPSGSGTTLPAYAWANTPDRTEWTISVPAESVIGCVKLYDRLILTVYAIDIDGKRIYEDGLDFLTLEYDVDMKIERGWDFIVAIEGQTVEGPVDSFTVDSGNEELPIYPNDFFNVLIQANPYQSIEVTSADGTVVSNAAGMYYVDDEGYEKARKFDNTVVLTKPIVKSGVYTIHFPYQAFNIGEETTSGYSKEKSVTFTVIGENIFDTDVEGLEMAVEPAHSGSEQAALGSDPLGTEDIKKVRFNWNDCDLELTEEGGVAVNGPLGYEKDLEAGAGLLSIQGKDLHMNLEEIIEEIKANVEADEALDYEHYSGIYGITLKKNTVKIYYATNTRAAGMEVYNDDQTLYYNIDFTKDSTLGVMTVLTPATDGLYRVYNLQGVNVLTTTDASDINALSPGIYIVGGKKVAVRK